MSRLESRVHRRTRWLRLPFLPHKSARRISRPVSRLCRRSRSRPLVPPARPGVAIPRPSAEDRTSYAERWGRTSEARLRRCPPAFWFDFWALNPAVVSERELAIDIPACFICKFSISCRAPRPSPGYAGGLGSILVGGRGARTARGYGW